ncbi:hypothetical protein HK097_000652 [Rhizophlyctis rosea]|uniref:Uncharacterized protein n=1 Tax=Rhizophlyctis rosea TaxID=64517 RepID=A0AAD5SHQ7_9FUNG|nr:hypothetical protein HK097_000652 [Rhizophlyctis rosea]
MLMKITRFNIFFQYKKPLRSGTHGLIYDLNLTFLYGLMRPTGFRMGFDHEQFVLEERVPDAPGKGIVWDPIAGTQMEMVREGYEPEGQRTGAFGVKKFYRKTFERK